MKRNRIPAFYNLATLAVHISKLEKMAEESCDILIMGSGAAGLAAAATSLEPDVLLVEQCETIGGTTATCGGTIWIPGSGRDLK